MTAPKRVVMACSSINLIKGRIIRRRCSAMAHSASRRGAADRLSPPQLPMAIFPAASMSAPGHMSLQSGLRVAYHTLILDGVELGSLASNLLEGGDVALYAFAQDEDVTIVTFDNLEVWALS